MYVAFGRPGATARAAPTVLSARWSIICDQKKSPVPPLVGRVDVNRVARMEGMKFKRQLEMSWGQRRKQKGSIGGNTSGKLRSHRMHFPHDSQTFASKDDSHSSRAQKQPGASWTRVKFDRFYRKTTTARAYICPQPSL